MKYILIGYLQNSSKIACDHDNPKVINYCEWYKYQNLKYGPFLEFLTLKSPRYSLKDLHLVCLKSKTSCDP